MSIDPWRVTWALFDHHAFMWTELSAAHAARREFDPCRSGRVLLLRAVEARSARLQRSLVKAGGPLRDAMAQVHRTERMQEIQLAWLDPTPCEPLHRALARGLTLVDLAAAVALAGGDPEFSSMCDSLVQGLMPPLRALARLAGLTDDLPMPPLAEGPPHGAHDGLPQRRVHAALLSACAEHAQRGWLTTASWLGAPEPQRLVLELAHFVMPFMQAWESVAVVAGAPGQTWLIQETAELMAYQRCLVHEDDPGLRRRWLVNVVCERAHMRAVADLMLHGSGVDGLDVVGMALDELQETPLLAALRMPCRHPPSGITLTSPGVPKPPDGRSSGLQIECRSGMSRGELRFDPLRAGALATALAERLALAIEVERMMTALWLHAMQINDPGLLDILADRPMSEQILRNAVVFLGGEAVPEATAVPTLLRLGATCTGPETQYTRLYDHVDEVAFATLACHGDWHEAVSHTWASGFDEIAAALDRGRREEARFLCRLADWLVAGPDAVKTRAMVGAVETSAWWVA